MWMVKSAIPAGENDLVTAIHATLLHLKQRNHSIVPPAVIQGENSSVTYAPSTARSQSVFNDRPTEVGHMSPPASTSPAPDKTALRSALSKPLTESEARTSAPRAQEETINGEHAPEGEQQARYTTSSESEEARAQEVSME